MARTFSLQNIAFERNHAALFTNVNRTLQAGDYLAIQGANGAGKSTLLRMCAGYIEPAAGDILWQQQSIFKMRQAFQQEVHYLGHQNGLKPQLTVLENLHLASALTGIRFNKSLALQALKQLHCSAFADTQTRYLSAGQCRRAALARLILQPRSLWLLDEPATALDIAGQHSLQQMLATHLRQGGMALVATHEAQIATPALWLGEQHV